MSAVCRQTHPVIWIVHHALVYAHELRPALTSQPGTVSHTIGSYSGSVREGTGDVRSLPVGGVNLCLCVTHKNVILFF